MKVGLNVQNEILSYFPPLETFFLENYYLLKKSNLEGPFSFKEKSRRMRQVVVTLMGLVLLSYGDAGEYVYDIDVDGLPQSADHEKDVIVNSYRSPYSILGFKCH